MVNDSKGAYKRQHKRNMFRENLLEIPLKSFMIKFLIGEEECPNGGFFYAFEKDFHAIIHVYFCIA